VRHIIATGGGIVERPENRALLRQLGYVVWLIVSPAEILRRTSRNKDRPLLNNDHPEETITRLLEHRSPIYKDTAHEEIETDPLTFPEIATGIIESGRYFFSHL
jgi:shikimate kinase